MVSKKIKASILEEIRKIQNSLKEKNDAQRGAIDPQVIAIIDMLKKHVLDKQKKLDVFIKRLYDLTDDDVATGLFNALDDQLVEIGNDYDAVLEFELDNTTTSLDAKNLEVLLQIGYRLSQLIVRLQSIEQALNSAVEDV